MPTTCSLTDEEKKSLDFIADLFFNEFIMPAIIKNIELTTIANEQNN
jgi:hypothetical protein